MKALKRILKILLVTAFWVGVWAITAWGVGKPLLLPSPADVAKTLWELLQTPSFYLITARSLLNILSGILIGVLSGVLLSILTTRVSLLRELILPVMSVVKATPVASFIILALIWIGAKTVPAFITVLIVLPVVWTNLDVGFEKIDPQLLEVTRVYGFSFSKQLKLLYLPSLKPYFSSAVRTSLGLAWKAGIAAEIIAMPEGAIGTMIGEAKLYIETKEMFAWTLTVILLSLLFEWIFTTLFDRLDGKKKEVAP